jgi:hypothetical protein
MTSNVSGRHVVIAAIILALGIPTFAVAAGEGRDLVLGKRNPQGGGELSRATEIISQNGGYSTRQSNKGSGGGAIYGCRSSVGAEPCVRANNLSGGRAFEFETDGNEAGRITVADAGAAPFSTNATGTVANLSSDRLDGRDSATFADAGDLLWASVASGGALAAGRGATASVRQGGPNAYIVTFVGDVSGCSYGVTATGGDNANKPGASVSRGGVPTRVRVDFAQAAGPTPFHLQVIC